MVKRGKRRVRLGVGSTMQLIAERKFLRLHVNDGITEIVDGVEESVHQWAGRM